MPFYTLNSRLSTILRGARGLKVPRLDCAEPIFRNKLVFATNLMLGALLEPLKFARNAGGPCDHSPCRAPISELAVENRIKHDGEPENDAGQPISRVLSTTALLHNV